MQFENSIVLIIGLFIPQRRESPPQVWNNEAELPGSQSPRSTQSWQSLWHSFPFTPFWLAVPRSAGLLREQTQNSPPDHVGVVTETGHSERWPHTVPWDQSFPGQDTMLL